LPLGSLYNPKGLVIDQYDLSGPKYLYVSEINSAGKNTILRINLTSGLYEIETFVTNLTYIPYSMTTKNDGYLYVNDTSSNAISKIAVDPSYTSNQTWITSCVYVPIASTFNIDGNLYVASSGTNPNNNKITKIYVDYFEFNVTLTNPGNNELNLYNVTTKTYVPYGTFNIQAV
jgi:sugar lactone lactonase YvrE